MKSTDSAVFLHVKSQEKPSKFGGAKLQESKFERGDYCDLMDDMYRYSFPIYVNIILCLCHVMQAVFLHPSLVQDVFQILQ